MSEPHREPDLIEAMLGIDPNDPLEQMAEVVVLLRSRIEALAVRLETEGITCRCGHYVGGDHNGLGCYARLSYDPLVTCPCELTDDQEDSLIAAGYVRDLLLPKERADG